MVRETMSRLPYLACAATVLLLDAKPQTEMFSKYKTVQAYEIRPGVLAMPRYAEDGQICEIGVEKRTYSPEMIRIGSSFSKLEIDEMVDELTPLEERGPRLKGLMGGMMALSGATYTNVTAYENVTIISYGGISSKSGSQSGLSSTGDAAFTIQWTKLKCK
jgi:hypothetical protein